MPNSYKHFAEALNEYATIAECENKLCAIAGYKNSEIIKYYSAEIAKYSNLKYADLIQMACNDILKYGNPENTVKMLIHRKGD